MQKSVISNDGPISFPDSALELVQLLDQAFKIPIRPPVEIPADQWALQRAYYDGQRSVIEWANGRYKQSFQDTES